MAAKLSSVIEFVGGMGRAVKFYRGVIGLPLKFESPGWSEFATDETTLALHPTSDKNPAGNLESGMLAEFMDSEGAHVSVGETQEARGADGYCVGGAK